MIAFDPTDEIIYVDCRIWGPRGDPARLRFALDTAATETLVVPHVLDRLGYSARMAERRTRITTALGVEPGYLIKLSRFECLGVEVSDFLVHAHDLADEHDDFYGLVGLSFLRQFNLEIRFGDGMINAELLSPASRGGRR